MAEEVVKVKFTIDPDKLVLGDLEVLQRAADGDFTEYLDLLERVAVIEGVDSARELPLKMLRQTMQAINDAIAVDTEGN